MNNKPYRPETKPAIRPDTARKPKDTRNARKTPAAPARDTFTLLASAELGVTVAKEYRFHPKRMWRFDYAVPEHRVAIEVEGGVWTAGRHVRPKGFLGDMKKYNTAAAMGWRLLRFTPDSLFSGATLDLIRRTIEGAGDGSPDTAGNG